MDWRNVKVLLTQAAHNDNEDFVKQAACSVLFAQSIVN